MTILKLATGGRGAGRSNDVPTKWFISQPTDAVSAFANRAGIVGIMDSKVCLYNMNGDPIWGRTFPANTYIIDVDYAPDNSGLYVLGETSTGGTSNFSAFLVKFKQDGTFVWGRRQTSAASRRAFLRMCAVNDSVYLVQDYSSVQMQWQKNSASTGEMPWAQAISTSSKAVDMAVTPGEDVYLAMTDTVGTEIPTLLKTDSTGAITWQRTIKTATTASKARSVSTNSAGRVAFLYTSGSAGTTLSVSLVESDATVTWTRSIAGTTNILGATTLIDQLSNVYVAVPTGSGAVVLKWDSSGTLQWQKQFIVGTAAGAPGRLSMGRRGQRLVLSMNLNAVNYICRIPDPITNGTYTVNGANIVVSTATLTVTSPTATVATPTLTRADAIGTISSAYDDYSNAFTSLSGGRVQPTLAGIYRSSSLT